MRLNFHVRRREFLIALAAATVARPASAQAKTVRAIGVLFSASESGGRRLIAALRQGLISLGYAEGRDFRIESRFANHDTDRLRALAKDLLASGAEIIVTAGTTSASAAHAETKRVPIVLAGSADPVAMGFAESLARPGGNVTGLSILGPEILVKRLELLHDAIPGAKVAGVLVHGGNPGVAAFRRALEESAPSLGLELRILEVQKPDDIEPIFGRFAELGVQALFVIEDPVFDSNADLLARLGLKHRLPIVTGLRSVVRAGGLVSYGVDNAELWRRAADFVDRIFKGAVPAEMPIEQLTKLELIVNLRTAKALGVVLPSSLVVRADDVIE